MPFSFLYSRKDKVFTTEEQKVCCGHVGVPSPRPSAMYTSEFIKKIRTELLTGNLDVSCMRCKNDEDNGIKSLRKTHLEWHGDVGINFEKDIDVPLKLPNDIIFVTRELELLSTILYIPFAL